ncbi:hypothetical protein F4810DRAFT_65282 [Camillea tinctor]|nr:hypothetical protein F4810DRAFT_65282 [Camillea tinctor]
MVARQALVTAGCSHCRLAILNVFTSPVRCLPSVRTGPIRPSQIRIPVDRISSSVRHLSSLPSESSGSSIGAAEARFEQDHEQDHEKDHDEHPGVAPEDPRPGDIPWYLQVEPPRHVASVEPPPLPEVPSDAPPLIEALLRYASDEMGLGELSLLDLRQLEPPPALGPNLFMLFGTARSERHLNVSAGRLLRWLRAKHHVSADADGLLGPNERKKKLRRKAKRARLLGTIDDDVADDGIKTGWICVNLGTIGRAGVESAVVSDDGRVAGFGASKNGFTVVLQIMTESRRTEMGLEMLWEQALERTKRRAMKAGPKVIAESLEDLHPSDKADLSRSQISQNGSSSKISSQRQARHYSTQRASVLDTPSPIDPLFTPSSTKALGQTLLYDGYQKLRLLEYLRAHLDQLTPLEAQAILGIPNIGLGTTPFLRILALATKNLPPHQTWEFRLFIRKKAQELLNSTLIEPPSPSRPFLKVPAVPLDNIDLLVKEMRLYGIQPTREQYLQLLSCIYSSGGTDLGERSKLAIELLETMYQRNQAIIANDIIVTLIEAIDDSSSSTDMLDMIAGKAATELIRKVESLIKQARLPCMDDDSLMRLMNVYARRRDWKSLWNVWQMPPRFLQPRSAAMYAHVYRLAASTGSAAICAMALRRCFYEMLHENPMVQPTGKVLSCLLECVDIADPRAQELVRTLPVDVRGLGQRLAKREFVKLVKVIRMFR